MEESAAQIGGGNEGAVAERYRDFMYGLIRTVLTEIGPRESCSENERRLGRHLADLWSGLGHEVRSESFTCHPKAFLGFIPVSALLYLAAIIVYWILPFVSALLAAAALAMVYFELLRYREFIDGFFAPARGENVVATVRPRGEVKRRVIVSAHQDSAYEFNLWYFFRNAAIPIMIVAALAPVVPLLGGLAKSFIGQGEGFAWVGYLGMALYPIVGLNLFFHTYSVVPGAMDDLAGISVLAGTAKALADARDGGESPLQHTEVVLLATSSEEAGLRGAKRYVSAHAEELRRVPSYGLFVDGVYDERFLTVVRHELSTGARHDPRLVSLAQQVAQTRGRTMREGVIPLGGTDAAAFSLAGVPSVCLLCQDISQLVPNYHTRLDVIDHVRPESLAVTLQVVLDMIHAMDDGAIS